MGNFNEHINHATRNVQFLSSINSKIEDSWDWQVTVSFYTALHIINAHIVNKTNHNYLSHNKVEEMINPYKTLSVAKLDEEIYLSYMKLFQLSRRSRYLLNENNSHPNENEIQNACVTYSKHLKKAVYHLDKIITFSYQKYHVIFPKVDIKCIDLKGVELSSFNIIK